MNKYTLGNRCTLPCYFDMASRFGLGKSTWYGRGFKLGDRAISFVYLQRWRANYPNRKLVVIDDTTYQECVHSRELPAQVLFNDIADEVWQLDSQETCERPPGENLYNKSLGEIWANMRNMTVIRPKFEIPKSSHVSASRLLASLSVPDKFVSLHPLIDATHTPYRNGSPTWWSSSIRLISTRVPTVVICKSSVLNQLSLSHSRVYTLTDVSTLDTLAIIKKATVHVGAETGFTLWASVLGTTVGAVYRSWDKVGILDWRPIPFYKPVVYLKLEGNISVLANTVKSLFFSLPVHATP